MKSWRVLIALLAAGLLLGAFWHLSVAAAPPDLEPGGLIVPLGLMQTDLRAAYAEPLRHVYRGGRVQWLAHTAPLTAAPVQPGDLYLPPGEVDADFCSTCATLVLTGTVEISRAYALAPGRIALFRSSVTYPIPPAGEAVAMWEYAMFRQLFDVYLRGAAPYTTLDEAGLSAGLEGYDLLVLPAFNREQTDAVIEALGDVGLSTIAEFVSNGGTLYAQGAGLLIAQAAGVLPPGTVDPVAVIELVPEDAFENIGRLEILMPESPLAWSWHTEALYVLDDPVLTADAPVDVAAVFTNTLGGTSPAVIQARWGAGRVIGVAGHPTDPTRRNQLPLFMDALFLSLSRYVEFGGDAIQTFNPAYPPHEFPAYEVVPVSATLRVVNLWDEALQTAIVTERLSPGYYLTGTVAPQPTDLYTETDGTVVLIWELGDLVPRAGITLTFQAVTSPTVLAAGVSTFSQGELTYYDPEGQLRVAQHRPFILYSQMAARLVGDRDVEGDRYYRIPAEGLYLDMALPLENKEHTAAPEVTAQDWVVLISPIVDIANQHVILSANDGETIWILNEPYLWGDKYPLWEGATATTQTLTLDDWQGERCVFTSTHGIHVDPLRHTTVVTDYGSFITIPPTYTQYISVTAEHELWLPCLRVSWDLGAFNGYDYREPALRYGVHSRELLGREVVFHGTPREGRVVLPFDAGSVFVAAGTNPVPYREYLTAVEPYAPQPPTMPGVTWLDVWSRTHTMTLRGSFYDVWDWDSCATCGGQSEQHVGFAVTFGIWADTEGDGKPDTLVKEIPTRLTEAQLRLLGKTYSVNAGDIVYPIPAAENVIDLPIFHGLGVKIGPWGATWDDSWANAGPGSTELITVSEQLAYDHLFFQQDIPPGSWASFVVSATIENYPFNREGLYKLHDGGRLVYRQPIAGANRYEVYDARVHAAEGWRSDAAIDKRGGPTLVSIYSDTVILEYHVDDPYEPRSGWAFEREYDPYLKCWGYGDLVWCTYVGGSEARTLFRTVLHEGDRTRVRVAVDNNTGITLTNLSVALELPPGITATLLYTDPATAPDPIWPELSFLNRTTVPDAWRSVWYFELKVGDDVNADLWDRLLEIPVLVAADGLPADYTAPPARVFLQRAEAPSFVSAPATALVLTDTLPAEVRLDAALLITDTVARSELWAALEADAADPLVDTASALLDTLLAEGRALTVTFAVTDHVATFMLPSAYRQVPAAESWYLIAKTTLLRAHHGTNVVNEGPFIRYTDPFDLDWTAQGPAVKVEAHGAALWVDYWCEGGHTSSLLPGTQNVVAHDGECYLPSDSPSEVLVEVTAYNEGDAVARGVSVTLEIPYGVTVTWSLPAWANLAPDMVSWSLGDLAPGAARQFDIVLRVEPDEGIWQHADTPQPEVLGQVLGVRRSAGEFTDDYTQQAVQGQVGGPLWFKVYFRPRTLYLPVVMRGYDSRPDLVVTEIALDPANSTVLAVHIANRGPSAAHNFWVDAYFNPATPPEVNQPWQTLNPGYGGAAWFVPELGAGESLVLALGDDFFVAEQSRWPTAYPVGEQQVWAYVDSWGYPQAWGGINEANETNNRYGPVTFAGTAALSTIRPAPLTPLPARPRYVPQGAR